MPSSLRTPIAPAVPRIDAQIRRYRVGSASQFGAGGSGAVNAPEASIAALEFAHRVEEVLAAEVGPQHVGEDELRVRALPQQVVGDPVLPRRADHEVRVWHVG